MPPSIPTPCPPSNFAALESGSTHSCPLTVQHITCMELFTPFVFSGGHRTAGNLDRFGQKVFSGYILKINITVKLFYLAMLLLLSWFEGKTSSEETGRILHLPHILRWSSCHQLRKWSSLISEVHGLVTKAKMSSSFFSLFILYTRWILKSHIWTTIEYTRSRK